MRFKRASGGPACPTTANPFNALLAPEHDTLETEGAVATARMISLGRDRLAVPENYDAGVASSPVAGGPNGGITPSC